MQQWSHGKVGGRADPVIKWVDSLTEQNSLYEVLRAESSVNEKTTSGYSRAGEEERTKYRRDRIQGMN